MSPSDSPVTSASMIASSLNDLSAFEGREELVLNDDSLEPSAELSSCHSRSPSWCAAPVRFWRTGAGSLSLERAESPPGAHGGSCRLPRFAETAGGGCTRAQGEPRGDISEGHGGPPAPAQPPPGAPGSCRSTGSCASLPWRRFSSISETVPSEASSRSCVHTQVRSGAVIRPSPSVSTRLNTCARDGAGGCDGQRAANKGHAGPRAPGRPGALAAAPRWASCPDVRASLVRPSFRSQLRFAELVLHHGGRHRLRSFEHVLERKVDGEPPPLKPPGARAVKRRLRRRHRRAALARHRLPRTGEPRERPPATRR